MFKIVLPLSEDPRPLVPGDMITARIGEKFWPFGIRHLNRKATHKVVLREFLANIVEHVTAGDGVVMHGPHGSSKTTSAVLILKAVIGRRGSALMIPAEDIYDVCKRRELFSVETGETMRQRMLDVSVLLIDDLNFRLLRPWERDQVENLVRRRADRAKMTIITTNHKKEVIRKKFKAGIVAMGKQTQFMRVFCKRYQASVKDGDGTEGTEGTDAEAADAEGAS